MFVLWNQLISITPFVSVKYKIGPVRLFRIVFDNGKEDIDTYDSKGFFYKQLEDRVIC